ncbi:hypothetical protein IMCC3135_18610 [Granulosicoccus antarcticus IMCC3135]|uniref:Uncharacterized protein n=1 Tax=Granulosicoccus antarcticus IMCC3135 TaxID=1192854 RepID=A0A2Z2NUV8_9GAMM|nr:hypothetical protein IMCC3135_18610 [Granulosicoccus antarcticus IMCC3135]
MTCVVSRGAGVTNTTGTNGRDEMCMRDLVGSYTLQRKMFAYVLKRLLP